MNSRSVVFVPLVISGIIIVHHTSQAAPVYWRRDGDGGEGSDEELTTMMQVCDRSIGPCLGESCEINGRVQCHGNNTYCSGVGVIGVCACLPGYASNGDTVLETDWNYGCSPMRTEPHNPFEPDDSKKYDISTFTIVDATPPPPLTDSRFTTGLGTSSTSLSSASTTGLPASVEVEITRDIGVGENREEALAESRREAVKLVEEVMNVMRRSYRQSTIL